MKRLIAFVLMAAMLLSICMTVPMDAKAAENSQARQSVVPGDFTGDGQLNSKDVEHLLWFTLFPSCFSMNQDVDLNDDGQVDSKDVEQLLWYSLFPADNTIQQSTDVKAMWLSQFDLDQIYLNGSVQRSKEDFTNRMTQILDNIKSQSFNTIFLQVRPYGDSMYPSEYYPTSACVAGKTGGTVQYDPLPIVIGLAHERGLSIHAWINPLRAMTNKEIQLVSTDYAIRRWYDDSAYNGKYIVLYNGRWYFNPAYDEVVELICNGAEEILQLYAFDGLHMDDYFYPTTDASFDSAAYAAYKANGGTMSLGDYRRDNVTKLVKRLYDLTHEAKWDRIYGVAPGGNIEYTCNSQYADVYEWVSKEGYIDYLCPQVYWGMEHQTHDFVKVCNYIQSLIKVDSLDLIIGMTFGKAYSLEDQWAGTGKDEWKNNKDVMARCLQATLDLSSCTGVSIFCYQFFYDPLTGIEVEETAQERANFMELFETITWN